MKKLATMAISIVLIACMVAGGSLAYLTSEDSTVNVMTLGNVKITQHEYQRADGIDYKNSGAIADGDELEPFEQGQLLFPSTYTDLSNYTAKVPNDEQFWWGSYVTADVSGNGSSNGLWDDKLTGAMDKFVFVENTGKSPAYYRTLIAFECPEGMEYSEGYDKEFMMNINLNDRFTWEKIDYITVDDARYLVMSATYNKVLEPNTVSRPSLLQVVMTHNATNEDMELLGEDYKILVLSQAVQAQGFDSAAAALNAGFGVPKDKHATETDKTNVEVWFGGVKIPNILNSVNDVNKSTNKSGTFILASDIETSGDATIPNDVRYGYGYEYIVRKGVDYTLDLNGKTINHKSVNKNENNNALTYLFVANNAGTKLTIDGNGKIYSHNSEGYTCAVQGKDGTLITINNGDFQVDNGIAVWAGTGAHIVINDGSFVNYNAKTDHELIYSSGGVIDIYGGFFHNRDGNYTLNVEDRNRATGFINVYGGTYVNFDPSTGGQDPNNIKVADGYKVISETQANGDVWYSVVPE